MVRHHLALLLRNVLKFRNTFLINLIGLSTALMVVLLIFLWVDDELRKDQFHANKDRLYQVFEIQTYEGSRSVTNSTPWLLARTLKEEMPEVDMATTVSLSNWFEPFTLSTDDKVVKGSGRYADEDFFSIFSFPLVSGQAADVLRNKASIVLSRDVAEALFPSGVNPLGKTVRFQQDTDYIITGVFENVPESSERFDFVLPFQNLIDERPEVTNWRNAGPSTYVVLADGTDLNVFNKKIKDVVSQKSDFTHRTLFATRYADLYLHGRFENGVQSGGQIEYVVLFAAVAVFILLIACINFMNLSTARASQRAKEVGIKKTVGAGRSVLVGQFLAESVATSAISVAVAILLVDLFLPTFNQITDKSLTLVFSSRFILTLVGLVVFTGFLAGSYPALYLSRFKPAAILKGMMMNSAGELWVRRGLVIFQFTLSIILVGVVLVIQNQIHFVLNKNLGYQKENLLYFEMEGEVAKRRDTFLEELRKIPGVVQASSMSQSMVGGGNTTNIDWEGKPDGMITSFAIRSVDYDAVDLLRLTLIEGRTFSRSHADSLSVVMNKTAIKAMGLENPIGKQIKIGPYDCPIRGVVEDFHFESLHSDVAPLFFILAPQHTSKIIIRLNAAEISNTIKAIEKLYRDFNPGFAFSYRFMDQDYDNQYRSETRIAMLSKYFAGIAILISSLGLFGLAAFTAERRQKEIGIRKALGASASSIVVLISSDFTKLVLVAVAIAFPISYHISSAWVDTFAYRIDVSWLYFVLAGLIAIVISWATIGAHAFRSAKINPAKCLKAD